MPSGPEDRNARRRDGTVGQLQTLKAPEAPADMADGNPGAAEPLFTSRERELLQQVEQLEAVNAALQAEAERARLLEQSVAREFGGTVRLDFAPAGVECRIRLPLAGKVAAP